MTSDVFLLEIGAAGDVTGKLDALTRRVLGRIRVRDWAVKVQLGHPGRVAAIAPGWAHEVAQTLTGSGGKAAVCGTLSINTKGLDTADSQRETAALKGYATQGTSPSYVVADDPRGEPSPVSPGVPDGLLGPVGLAAAAAGSGGLAVMTPVRPHPHLGLTGALSSLGLGLVDRDTKLRIHRDLRPRVNTPLCAGCGSCLAVCIFDAININAGRAFIDHERCTGCGECMNVCFMAGIAPEDLAGVPVFQRKVAEAASAARVGTVDPLRPAVFLNVLVRPDRAARGPRRQREVLGDVGVLGATDPVALDTATADLIRGRSGGSLQSWSGFLQEPGPLLERAAELDLGRSAYRLHTFQYPGTP